MTSIARERGGSLCVDDSLNGPPDLASQAYGGRVIEESGGAHQVSKVWEWPLIG